MGTRIYALFALAVLMVCTVQTLIFIPIETTTSQSANAWHEIRSADEGPSVNDSQIQVTKIGDGLARTTSMAFLGSNDILVLEQWEGTVRRIVDGQLIEKPLLKVDVGDEIEWGMLGIAVSKNGSDSSSADQSSTASNSVYVFLYYTEPNGGSANDDSEPGDTTNNIYRYELVDGELVNPKLLLSLPAFSPNTLFMHTHVGGKLRIGPDNSLYASIGDIGGREGNAQNFGDGDPLDGSSGILRIDQDGEVLLLPFAGQGGEMQSSYWEDIYFAYGIRNSFGFDFDPVTGTMWDTENGSERDDEINMVKKGFNSGWKQVQGFAGDDFEPAKDLVSFQGSYYDDPNFVWEVPVGVTALKFLSSSALGEQYKNTMFVGDVRTGNLYNFKLNAERNELALAEDLADKVANDYDELEPVVFGEGFGLITDITQGPDGFLYILNYMGEIYKISN